MLLNELLDDNEKDKNTKTKMVNSVENDEVLSKSMNNGPRVSFNRDVHVKRYG